MLSPQVVTAAFQLVQVLAAAVACNQLWMLGSYYWRQFLKRQYQNKVVNAEAQPRPRSGSTKGGRHRHRSRHRSRSRSRSRSPSPRWSDEENGYSSE